MYLLNKDVYGVEFVPWGSFGGISLNLYFVPDKNRCGLNLLFTGSAADRGVYQRKG